MGAEEQRAIRVRRWVDLLSAAVLALATVATAWCAYQAARWGEERGRHVASISGAHVKIAKFSNLSQQRLGLHIGLFSQWMGAVITDNTKLADFLLTRFPEPLKSATVAWRATQPLTNPSAPATPFELPEYALPERAEVPRWEAVAEAEGAAAEAAGDVADRYLLFTIGFASVLFFGGMSGKFRWLPVDVAVLVCGAVALLAGLVILFVTPVL